MLSLHVRLHRTEVPERLGAVFTAKVILPRVAGHMLLQVCHARESLLAELTRVLVDPLVRLHVITVALPGLEPTTAEMAGH